MNADDRLRACITEPVLQQRLAKYMVLQCFRNSMLEDLHAGVPPSSAAGDYSDVTVSSPYGVIPWPKVSRLNGDEMKQLMIDVVNRAYALYTCCSIKKPALSFCSSLHKVTLSRAGMNPY